MSREKSISKKAFMAAYSKHKAIVDIAVELGVCEMTVRNYISQFGLIIVSSKERRERSIGIYNSYCGTLSIVELAQKYEMDLVTIRYHLRKAMVMIYSSKDRPKWPMPKTLSHIKIVHELNKKPNLISNTARLAELTGLPEPSVRMYQQEYIKSTHRK